MKISYIKSELTEAKKTLEGLNLMDFTKKEYNQKSINIAYNILDDLLKQIKEEYKRK